MFKNMKLGTKISVGFGMLIVIACIVGGLAVWNMDGVKTVAEHRWPTRTCRKWRSPTRWSATRSTPCTRCGATPSPKTKFLDEGRRDLAEGQEVPEGGQGPRGQLAQPGHAGRSRESRSQGAGIRAAAQRDGGQDRRRLEPRASSAEEAADKYMKICNAYSEGSADEDGSRNCRTARDAAAIEGATAEDRHRQRHHRSGQLDRHRHLEVHCQPQPEACSRKPRRMFDEVNAKLDELKADHAPGNDLKQIEECRAAGKAYQAAWTSFLANWFAREDLSKQTRRSRADASSSWPRPRPGRHG